MKLDPRLAACAEFIDEGSVVCDVGTDHAYLPVFLVENNICIRAVAADIGEGPLEAAKQHIKKYGLEGKISTVLSDGLEKVPKEGITHVVVAGMGGETICSVLENCSCVQDFTLVLQPMTKAETVRRWLFEHGFKITAEKAVVDGKFIYVVMKAVFFGENVKYTPLDVTLGAMDLSVKSSRAYAERKASQLEASSFGKLKSKLSRESAAGDKNLAEAIRNVLSKTEEN